MPDNMHTVATTMPATANVTVTYYDARMAALEQRLTDLEEDHNNLRMYSIENIKDLVNKAGRIV